MFSSALAPNMAPALCLRHDVDGLIWQPLGDELEASWKCLHAATFQALGYVQASKQQRKFTGAQVANFKFCFSILTFFFKCRFQVCPPNFSYAACCDALRHIYVYRQPTSNSSGVELVHRPTGRRIGAVAKQQVINLETGEQILGALATDVFLLILTSSTIFAFRVNDE